MFFSQIRVLYAFVATLGFLATLRALSSGLSNVPNAKYLAHLTHQTQKQVLIRYAKCAKIIEHATVRSHFLERTDENAISVYWFFIHHSLSSLIILHFSLLSPSLSISSLSVLPAQDLSHLCSRSLAASPRRQPPQPSPPTSTALAADL